MIAVLLVAGLLFGSPEGEFFRALNQFRQDRGKEPLVLGHRMTRYAEYHSGQMERRGELFHSDVSFPKSPGWSMAGENIGFAPSVEGLMKAFRQSQPHRRNMLRGIYERVGIGVKRGDGRLWVTFEFLG